MRAKLDVAFFGWVWLIVESRNILCMQNLRCANSSIVEVKNKRMEAFVVVPVFLYALLFVSTALELLFLLSSPHWAIQLRRVTSM